MTCNKAWEWTVPPFNPALTATIGKSEPTGGIEKVHFIHLMGRAPA
jgi:hypothetical protein